MAKTRKGGSRTHRGGRTRKVRGGKLSRTTTGGRKRRKATKKRRRRRRK